eukprot:8148214-Pyramimonas_sp.AAC.1
MSGRWAQERLPRQLLSHERHPGYIVTVPCISPTFATRRHNCAPSARDLDILHGPLPQLRPFSGFHSIQTFC